MKDRLFYFLICASMAVTLSSCDNWSRSDRGNEFGGSGKSVGIIVNTMLSESTLGTRAGDTAAPANVYASSDGDLIIEEFVSDITDRNITSPTRGTEIKQKQGSPDNNFNVANRQFMVMAYLDTVKTISGSDVTYHVNEFNYPIKYDGSKWNWVLNGDDAPCWRTSTKYSIWSYWPMDADVTSGSRSSISEPDGDNWAASGKYTTVSFTHTVPRAPEDQQDLLFAYNEETRDFAHIDNDDKKKYVYDDKEQSWIDNESNDSQIFDGANSNPKTRNIDIRFYHALSAVKFELNSSTTGADVHSITLCCTDNTASHNIITNDGIATSGSCTVTGNPASTGDKVTFAWTGLGNKKPLHYEFDSSHSVAGSYTKTGNGVLFMIPQSLSGVKVIVEFSKNGSTDYYTKVVNLPAVTWTAGKYYTYKLSIGEFHVPGENFSELEDIDIQGLMNSTSNIQPSSALNIKGVTKIGLVINSWRLGSNDDQTVYLNAITDGDSQVEFKTVSKITSPDESKTPNTNFDFNFAPVSDSALPGTNDKIFSFGTDDTEEEYHTYYSFSPPTGPKKSNMGTPKIGPFYYVFKTEGASTFQIIFTPSAADNSGGFFADVRCLIVVEVAEDPNIPGNFPLSTWP